MNKITVIELYIYSRQKRLLLYGRNSQFL